MSLQAPKLIISGGGTGGHIFPAVAIANAIKQSHPNAEILFVGAKGKMEMQKVPAAGYAIEGLWISGFQRSKLLANVWLPLKIISSYLKAKSIIKKFKPDVVIGTGGYASWAVMKAAGSLQIPTVIQEQNSFAGKTNMNLAKNAALICVAYEDMDKFFPKEKIRLTGNPIRLDIQNLSGKKQRGLEFFKLDENKKTILVIGGSLGARTINEAIANLLPQIKEKGYQLIWQTGTGYFIKAKEATVSYEDYKLFAFDFVTKMDLAYSVADVVISRAGASSVSELCCVKKASILIPSPNVAEDHQTQNAMALVNHKAAILVKDNEAKEKLGAALFELLENAELKEQLENNISKLAYNNASEVIANEIIHLIK